MQTDRLVYVMKCRRMILLICERMKARKEIQAARKRQELKAAKRRMGCPAPEKRRLFKGVVNDEDYGSKPKQMPLALAVEILDGREVGALC